MCDLRKVLRESLFVCWVVLFYVFDFPAAPVDA
jgi:hypothetical protein